MDTAFEILAEEHRPMLLGYALALMNGDGHDAEDVVQETLLAAYRSLACFEKGANFAAWLRGIARNKALESRRATRRRRIVVDSRIVEGIDEVYALFDAASHGEENWTERMQRLLDRCLQRLSRKLRDAVVRVYREDLSLQEAAAALGATPDAVAQRLSRARESLRRCVSAQGGNEP
jgi:RNA polymerase sigma-70 factor (ECF subfamily)